MPNRKSLHTKQVSFALQQQLFTLESNIYKKEYTLAEIGDLIPSVVLVDNLVIPCNEYMNKAGCEVLQHTREELFLLGENYYKDFFHPEEAPKVITEMAALLQSGDTDKVIYFYHRVRPNVHTPFKWFYLTCKIFQPTESSPLSSLILTGAQVNAMGDMAFKLNRLIEESEFAKKNYSLFTTLTRREKEILQLTALGHSSKAISDQLHIALLTVEQHRKNIRKKLGIKNFADLLKFALAFDLI